MNKPLKWLIIFVVVIFCLSLAKNFLIKSAIEWGAKAVVGTSVKIQQFSLGMFSQKIRIKGFQVYNPQGFPSGILVDIPEIGVDCDIPSLLKGKNHIPLLIIDMKEMIVVKNKQGKLNVNSLKVSQKPEEKNKASSGKKAEKPVVMQIDRMKLTVRKVIYKDYTSGAKEPKINVVDVGIQDKEFKNITSAQQLASLVLYATFNSAALKSIGLYGAATVMGTAFLPVGIAAMVLMDNSATQVFDHPFNDVWNNVKMFLDKDSQNVKADMARGMMTAVRNKYSINVHIIRKGPQQVEVKVEAKRMMLANKQEAERVLYEISDAVK
ncbi:MAG: AsmA family protein [Candidatus Omnitrophica bacterium]|nr:AsmA family protein [Candidatus Omnitrophota bacterium]